MLTFVKKNTIKFLHKQNEYRTLLLRQFNIKIDMESYFSPKIAIYIYSFSNIK